MFKNLYDTGVTPVRVCVKKNKSHLEKYHSKDNLLRNECYISS